MNHLAHFHLAGDREEMIVGALLADHVKGPLRGALPAGLEAGVRLHRQLDAFTDSHPLLLELRRLFPAGERRLAGPVLDMWFDHWLARHWQRFHPAPLDAFAAGIHAVLERHADALPAAARLQARRLRDHDLLVRYAETGIIAGVLERIGERLGQPDAMRAASRTALDNAGAIEQAFLGFYPLALAALSAAAGTR